MLFLPAVLVSRIHTSDGVLWWTVRDTEEPVAITVTDGVPPLLKIGETIDLQASVYWAGGQPYLTNVRCWAYTDSAGNILYQNGFPYFRGTLTELWPYTVELDVPRSASAQCLGMARIMDDGDPGEPPGGTDSTAIYTTTYCPTIRDAISCYDPNASEAIMVEIDAYPQTADPAWQGSGSPPDFILTEDTSSDQIPVIYANSGSISAGDRLNVTVGAIQCDSTGSNYRIAVQSLSQDQPAGYIQDIPQAVALPYARTCRLGAEVTVQGVEVYADQTMFPNTLYCELPGQFQGCKIFCDLSDADAYLGDIIDVTGQTGVDSNGEWYIDATQSTNPDSSITVDSSNGPPGPGPYGMTNKDVGGKFNATLGEGVTYSVGPLNLGWLVRTWGKVVYVDPGSTFFLMDDGSGVPNGIGVPGSGGGAVYGLAVDLTSLGSPAIIPPRVGWVLGVTGVSSCDSIGGACYSVLRPRTEQDITVYSPAGPSVTITARRRRAAHRFDGKQPLRSRGRRHRPR